MRKIAVLFILCLIFAGNCVPLALAEGKPFVKEGLQPILTRPDMVVLIPNAGIVFVYRDKYGNVVQEEYYSIRVKDYGVGLCDDVGNNDVWLFMDGGMLLHREDDMPKGIKPYWRHLEKDESYLHNEKSTMPRK